MRKRQISGENLSQFVILLMTHRSSLNRTVCMILFCYNELNGKVVLLTNIVYKHRIDLEAE